MTTKQAADQAVSTHLRRMEREMDHFGSALPENKDRLAHHLVITQVDSHEFGWVYFYSSESFVETGDIRHALGGNAPLIVDRKDCKLYSSGTAKPIEHYVEEFRAGIRNPL